MENGKTQPTAPQLPGYTITPFCKSVRKMENGETTGLREQSPHSYDKKH